MSTTVAFEIDDDTAAYLDGLPEALSEVACEAFVLELFRRAAISGGRGAALLGIDRLAFMRLASARRIPVIDLTPEEWQEEVRRVRSL